MSTISVEKSSGTLFQTCKPQNRTVCALLLFAFSLNGVLPPDLIYLFILIVDPIDKINFLRIESDSKLIDTLKVGDHTIPGHSVALQIGGENVHLACQ